MVGGCSGGLLHLALSNTAADVVLLIASAAGGLCAATSHSADALVRARGLHNIGTSTYISPHCDTMISFCVLLFLFFWADPRVE